MSQSNFDGLQASLVALQEAPQKARQRNNCGAGRFALLSLSKQWSRTGAAVPKVECVRRIWRGALAKPGVQTLRGWFNTCVVRILLDLQGANATL